MNNQQSKLMYLGVIAILVVGFVWMPINAAEKQHDHSEHAAKIQAAGEKKSHDSHKSCDSHKSHVTKLEEAIKAIDEASKAVEANDKPKALAHLAKARKLVATLHQAMLSAGRIVNSRCPLMGSKLDPSKVSADLTRVYEGKKIGFCCKGCPAKWDKLSDTERKEKLSKLGHTKPQHMQSMKNSDCGSDSGTGSDSGSGC